MPTWGSLHERQLLYAATASSGERIGPIRYEADAPGYEPEVEELFAYRIEQEIRSHTIELSPEEVDRGSLNVDFRWVWDMPQVHTRGPVGFVKLFDVESSQVLAYRLESLAAPVVIRHVPYGVYYVRLTIENTEIFVPNPAQKVVMDRESVDWTFGLEPYGSAQWVLERGGSQYAGPAALRFFKGSPDEGGVGGFVSYHGPPYALPVLSPGDYTVVFEHPEVQRSQVSISVYPSQVTRERLQLRQ